jgi:predicted RNase H-like HicB family nuclease
MLAGSMLLFYAEPSLIRLAHNLMTEITLTAIYEVAEEGGYLGYVAELPGANTQGETLEEVRENLSEAIQMILDANREEFERQLPSSAQVTREKLILRAA